MERYNWAALNKQQLGAYAEYFVKMELTMYGFQVFGTEVDDRGADFVTRFDFEEGPFLAVQVNSLRCNLQRPSGYAFMPRSFFRPQPHLYLALGLLDTREPPALYLIPPLAWLQPNSLLADREYVGLKSKPEYGINISKKNMPLLELCRFETTVEVLLGEARRSTIPPETQAT